MDARERREVYTLDRIEAARASLANPAAVQRILRHSDIRVTMDVYGHLAPGYLRTEIDRLSFRPKSNGFTSPVYGIAASMGATAQLRLDRREVAYRWYRIDKSKSALTTSGRPSPLMSPTASRSAPPLIQENG